MGTYYKVCCDEMRESICPGQINDLGIKLGAIVHPSHPFGAVVVFAMATRWEGKQCRIVNDCDDDPGYFDYKEVTKEVLAAYNQYTGTELRFTPD